MRYAGSVECGHQHVLHLADHAGGPALKLGGYMRGRRREDAADRARSTGRRSTEHHRDAREVLIERDAHLWGGRGRRSEHLHAREWQTGDRARCAPCPHETPSSRKRALRSPAQLHSPSGGSRSQAPPTDRSHLRHQGTSWRPSRPRCHGTRWRSRAPRGTKAAAWPRGRAAGWPDQADAPLVAWVPTDDL